MIGVQTSEEFLKGFANATGPLPLGLKNDFVAHYVFLNSPPALKGLICAVMKLDPSSVKQVRVMNPIDYGEYIDKLIILDIKVDMDNREYFDVEIQVYLDSHWEKRSLLYLCRTYADGIGSCENYDKLKPATLITITDKDLVAKGEKEREFLEEHGILNIRTHRQYSSLLRIKTLNLHNIDCATEEDKKSGLVFWAKLFSAKTWEEIRNISEEGDVFMEAARQLYNVNLISEEKTVMEAHQRYLAVQKGQKDYYEDRIGEIKSELDETKFELEESKKRESDKDRLIEELRSRISELQNKNDAED